ncbi:MAG: ABC transporter ATP-binding protein, partial [Burkholderiaceae bacterium]|nr:ABC transporter ATP-binding protein [Burkholderiaceae bacterium]
QWALTRDGASTQATSAPTAAQAAQATATTSAATLVKEPKKKLSYKEQRERDGLPNTIAQLEAEHGTATAQLDNGNLFASDVALATQLTQRLLEIDDALLEALERLETLGG